MDEIASIKNVLASYHIQLSSEWLQSCVSWCKEEILPPNYTIKDLQLKVYEQWLLLDLRDVEVPCLPPGLSDKIKYSLNGRFALQMMKVIDISKSKHWQLQKIRKSVSADADEEKTSAKRLLQLTLTDGVQEIEAMEYKPIPNLNFNLTPGIKILLTGPISVRRGRLMLQNHHVKILGGEVEELITPNATENVLAKYLNLPLNPNPKVIEESMLSANKDMFSETGTTTRPGSANANNVRNNLGNQPIIGDKQDERRNLLSASTTIPISQSRSAPLVDPVDIAAEEEIRIAAEIDMLMEVEREFEDARPQARKTPDMFDEGDINDFDFSKINVPATVISSSKEPHKVSSAENKPATSVIRDNSTVCKTSVVDLSESLDMESDFFDSIDIDSHLDRIEKNSKNKCTSQKSVILTIDKLLKNIPNISNGKFKIKATFKSIVEKLSIADNGFHLVVEVEDESGHIAVRFQSDVIANLAECCPDMLLSLKTGVLEKNAEAQRKVLEALKKIKEKLLLLDNVIEVQINGKETYPVVINILDIS